MESLQQTNVTNAVNLPAKVSYSREATILNQNPPSDQEEIDSEETDLDSPMFDSFYEESGFVAIVKLTNFSPQRLFNRYEKISDTLTEKYNKGRRINLKFPPKTDLL